MAIDGACPSLAEGGGGKGYDTTYQPTEEGDGPRPMDLPCLLDIHVLQRVPEIITISK